MIHSKRYIPLVIAWLMWLTPLVATALTFTARAPRQVVEGETFQVMYVLDGGARGSDLTVPAIEGTKKLYGPATSIAGGHSTTVIINGKTVVDESSASTYIFTCTYRAMQAGKVNVGSASITANGRRMHTRPFTLTILPNGSSQSQPQGSYGAGGVGYTDPMTQSAGQDVNSGDLFVRIALSKENIYEQEAVVCTVKLYTRYGISQFMCTQQPSFEGFLIEELKPAPFSKQVENYQGKSYYVAELKKVILYPQQSGKLTITSGNYDVKVVQNDVYGTPVGAISFPVEKQVQFKSNSATINILPLPSPKPANFSGAVGKFSVNASVTPSVLKTYAPANYCLTVSGTGNLKYIKAPTVTFPQQFDTYDPQNQILTTPNGDNISGSVKFNYQFIPQFVGDFKVEGYDFVYFDSETHRYETLHVQPINMKVSKGEGKPSSHYKLKNQDIAALKTGDLHLSKSHNYIVDDVAYWLGYLLPLLGLLAVIVLYRKKLRQLSDVRLMRTKRAGREAHRRLQNARSLLGQGSNSAFYAEVLNALWGYMGDKLGIATSALNKENIATALSEYGADAEVIDATVALLDRCEFAQYAPEERDDDKKELLNQAEHLMNRLENVKHAKK